LPGLDDGPSDRIKTLDLCRALAADGIETVVATPHQLGRFEGCYDAGTIRDAVAELNGSLRDAGIPLTILPGADVRLDERIPRLIETGDVLTVADRRRYLLLELPHEVFIDPQSLLPGLASIGVAAILTHPERHVHLARNPGLVERWVEFDMCLQLTAGSFGGGFGQLSQDAAWTFVCAPIARFSWPPMPTANCGPARRGCRRPKALAPARAWDGFRRESCSSRTPAGRWKGKETADVGQGRHGQGGHR
jgi:protein-tyrosine phosphatase